MTTHNSRCNCCFRIDGIQGNLAVDMMQLSFQIEWIGLLGDRGGDPGIQQNTSLIAYRRPYRRSLSAATRTS